MMSAVTKTIIYVVIGFVVGVVLRVIFNVIESLREDRLRVDDEDMRRHLLDKEFEKEFEDWDRKTP